MAARPILDARDELAAHLPGLADLVKVAHDRFRDQCAGVAHLLDARTKASIYRDLIVREVRAYADGTPGAEVVRRGQLVLLGLESRWLIRVKRLGPGFAVAVSPTFASEDYDANEVPASVADWFQGMTPATCLYLGWTVAENAPDEISAYLVCNTEERHVAWVLPLERDEPPPPVEQDLPFAPASPSGQPSRVRVRKSDAEKKANG